MPTFEKGMEQQRQEIEIIINNLEAPTFENTIEALEKSGELLTTVRNVFDNLKSAHTNDSLQRIATRVTPLLTKHDDDILLNENVYQFLYQLWRPALNISKKEAYELQSQIMENWASEPEVLKLMHYWRKGD